MYVKGPNTVPGIKLESKYVSSFLSSRTSNVDCCFIYFANAVKGMVMGRLAKYLCGIANLGICFLWRTSLEALDLPSRIVQAMYVPTCLIQFNKDL